MSEANEESSRSAETLSAGLEREFEKLHGIKWSNAAYSVRACWIDAWMTATAYEREACAKVCEEFDFNERVEIEPPRTLPKYCAAAIRKRSNARVGPRFSAVPHERWVGREINRRR